MLIQWRAGLRISEVLALEVRDVLSIQRLAVGMDYRDQPIIPALPVVGRHSQRRFELRMDRHQALLAAFPPCGPLRVGRSSSNRRRGTAPPFYRDTLQADALKLVAKKLQSSLAVEGELPEDGLAAFGDDGDDMMALARKIVSGDEDEDTETVEEVFAQTRNAEATAEELLVDEGWKIVEVEPEIIGVNGNGASGHHDEAEEPQQSLFSWAEFKVAGPFKPKRSRR